SFLIARMTPMLSVLAMVALVLLLVVVNALVLFDRYNFVTASAGPLVVIALVWAGLTVIRFVVERRERSRITARFRSYVDPALVQYVIEHPEQASLEGQVREM